MLIYRSGSDERSGGDVWRGVMRQATALQRSAGHDDVVALLIAMGEAESAIADVLFHERDGVHPLADALRRAAVLSAHALLASERQDRVQVERCAADLVRALGAIPFDSIPQTLAMSVSEGYAYYALHPERYAKATREFLRERQPAGAAVIGVRSIGTSLSAVVAATLESQGVPVSAYSVRPRGHPFDRTLRLDPVLADTWSRDGGRSFFLVVDEGPGLSGSSFASVVRALTALGVPSADVVLFPSWNPDGAAFKSEVARGLWQNHRRYCVESTPDVHGDLFDWRPRLYASEEEWPATQPQHERLKWLAPPDIARFAGLGHYGIDRRRRAEALAAEGLGPAPIDLVDGYLTLPYIDGRPCTASDFSRSLGDAIASHIGAVTRLFPSPRRPDVRALQHMVETNVREGLGEQWLQGAALESDERRALEDAPTAAIDGRMLAHEWIRTAAGFRKVDALDHHADHFFPGVQDAGWDLASVGVEFDLPDAARNALADHYVRLSGDTGVQQRLRFYERAYLAFRLGYAIMARETLSGTPESSRFDALTRSYRTRLERVLRRRTELQSLI